MRKPKRKKVYREWLENQLDKYSRRIQKLAEAAYHIRQAIAILDQQEMKQDQNTAVPADIQADAVDAAVNAAVNAATVTNAEITTVETTEAVTKGE